MENQEKDYLCLKWGSLKEWSFHSKKAIKLLKEFGEIGMCASAMCQKNTDRQKEIICELIDEGNFEGVFLDWDGKWASKDKAKKYIMEYDRK
jgi:hypothetical protein